MTFKFSLILLIITIKPFCLRSDIISGAATAVGVTVLSASFASYNYLKCSYSECCDDTWIRLDELRLHESFKQKLFGQHLADFVVRKTLHGFHKNKNHKKALVMSFHGLTGSGKNYLASLVANCTYKNGMSSAYVHMYSGVNDFPHEAGVSEYKDRIRNDITRFTKQCGRSLFIFDEIDKMPPGTLDAVKPFIDYYEHIDGVDYRNNIFIFLSNAGSDSIVKIALKFWADGREREEITMRGIEPLVTKGAFNENGGFQFSELLRSELVDVFVPFLPLEKKHVMKCIKEELKNRGKEIDSKLVRQIADDLVYFPSEAELYSKSGCKRIEQKIDLYID